MHLAGVRRTIDSFTGDCKNDDLSRNMVKIVFGR
jgi:hypothetical protein